MVDMLAKENGVPLRCVNEKKIVDALRYGQALSALNCAFEGARGSMYGLNKERLAREVKGILARKEAETSVIDSVSHKANLAIRCVCPVCQQTTRKRTKGKI